jgi:hypothetical protein
MKGCTPEVEGVLGSVIYCSNEKTVSYIDGMRIGEFNLNRYSSVRIEILRSRLSFA